MSTIQNKKSILTCTSIKKKYDKFSVLNDVSFSVYKGEKVGLVGNNGAGKSTLLKIIAGKIDADAGLVTFSSQARVGYIPQDFQDYSHYSVKRFIIESAKADPHTVGYDALPYIKKLSLDESVLERTISELSGGEKTKIALLSIYIAGADIVLLDEPTNNLDLEALHSLEQFIDQSNKTFLVISHDREFLDRTVGKIIEIDDQDRMAKIYDGNFTSYYEVKKAAFEKRFEVYEDNKKELKRLKDTIEERNARVKRIHTKAKRDSDKFTMNFKNENAERQINKATQNLKDQLEDTAEIEKPKTLIALKLSFDVAEKGSDKVFNLENVSLKAFGKEIMVPDFSVNYGDRILITGQNGSGKTSFIRLLSGITEIPYNGSFLKGSRVQIGYLPQEEHFNSKHTLLAEFLLQTGLDEGVGRRHLNRFRLTEIDVFKSLQELSPGERSRLVLAILMAKEINCLILDEPSNHLDLEAIEKLEEALKLFKGTLIVVSHDRYFIKKVGFDSRYDLSDELLKIKKVDEIL